MNTPGKFQELHSFYDTLPSGICLFTTQGSEQILFVNPGFLSLYSCTTEEEFQFLTGGTFQGMVDPEDYQPLETLGQKAAAVSHQETGMTQIYLTFRIKTREGHFRRIEGTLSKGTLPQVGTVWIMNLVSSSQKVLVRKQDPVTGLMGVRAFYQTALNLSLEKKAQGRLKSYNPVYLNLTNFKLYNATWGIQAGDNLLRSVASILQSLFPGQLMTRLTGDGFVLLAPAEKLRDKLQEAARQVDQCTGNPTIQLKAGIYPPNEKASLTDLRHAFDMAKFACDSIKKNAIQSWAVYTPELAAQQETRVFVLENFSRALQSGQIQVYYQPIIRSLTGKLCSLEALARWIDPERGMISPGIFVPILEEARLIHQLDQYVLSQAGKLLREQRRNHQPMIPISVNFSRVDFLVTDPFQLVEKVVRKYGLQRNFLCIEVTESALVQHSSHIFQTLQKFHNSGYKIWLDDFGSAYSSLNVLHNYHFDELKIDQAFLKNLNDKGKEIITSIVLMAKTLGVHTLAEGVETEEQLAFLKKIGCEKIQGFYYSRPLPYEKLLTHLMKMHIKPENSLENQCYEQAGLMNVVSEAPLGLFRYTRKYATLLYINEAYQKVLASVGTHSLEEANENLLDPAYPFRDKFRMFLDQVADSTATHSLVYVDNGQYIRIKARKIMGNPQFCLGRLEIQNITFDKNTRLHHKLDKLFRNLVLMYDSLMYLDIGKDQVQLLQSSVPSLNSDAVYPDIAGFLARYAKKFVHPDDREKFLQFTDPDSLHAQGREQGRVDAKDQFRIRRPDGNYRWMIFHAMFLYKDPTRNILLTVQDNVWERKDLTTRRKELPLFNMSLGVPLEKIPQTEHDYQTLLWNAVRTSPLKFFWKDSQRRFRGASRSFLKFYGLEEKDILGKTDEEMGWHPMPDTFQNDEEEVVHQGRTITQHLGTCIVRGVPHPIVATKSPLYKGNQIVGLLGYFDDLENYPAQAELIRDLNLKDPETGFLSYRGMLEAGLQYADSWRYQQDDYAAFLLDIPEFDQFRRTYGPEAGRKLLTKVVETFQHLHLPTISLAHIGSCCFLGFTKTTLKDQLDSQIQKLTQAIHGITEVDGYSCTLYLQYALARGSEVNNLDNLLALLTERLKESRDQRYGESVFIGDRIVFDREKFDTMDELVMISDPETYEMVYMNQAAQKAYHVDGPREYKEKKCYELLEGQKAPCAYCPLSILRQDRFHTATHHSVKSGLDLLVRDTLVPWRGRVLHFSMALNLKEYVDMDIARNDLIFREAAANDAIAIGLREEDPDLGIQKMIIQLAENMGAERFYIFEEGPDDTVSATYEWVRKGLEPMKDQLQHVPKKDVQLLYNSFDKEQLALIPDMPQLLAKQPDFHLRIPGIRSIVSGHLTQGERSLGYTEVVNPTPDTFQSASLLLATLTRFFAIMLRIRNNRRTLQANSRTDQLTGLGNRYAFHDTIASLPSGQDLVFVFGDINGLKRVNDTQGHEAGDRLIRSAAQVLDEMKGLGKVFRMGGDEFLLIREIDAPAEAEELIHSLKDRYKARGISVALGAVTCRTPIPDVDQILTQVDRKMYKDKGVMYGRRSTDR